LAKTLTQGKQILENVAAKANTLTIAIINYSIIKRLPK